MRHEILRDMLAGYHPHDPAEVGYLKRMRELCEEPGACLRTHFVPGHFTGSALVLSPTKSDVLLLLHQKLGIWIQPGGHVEITDPDLYSAAKRELAEEVGITELTPLNAEGEIFDIDIHTFPARKDEPSHEHFDVRFAFVAPSRQIISNHEAAAVRWVPLEDISLVTRDASVVRAVTKLAASLG